jgi:hypothetical protein
MALVAAVTKADILLLRAMAEAMEEIAAPTILAVVVVELVQRVFRHQMVMLLAMAAMEQRPHTAALQ